MDNYLINKKLWTIPKDRSKPIYKHIEDLVIRHIRDGTIRPRQPLPSYPWLSKTLGVADKTVRQAYAELQQAGIVVIVSGKGTFVAPQPAGAAQAIRSGTGMLGAILRARPGVCEGEYSERALTGVIEVAAEYGWSVCVDDTGQAERMAERHTDAGLVLLARPEAALWRKLSVLPRPMVWVGADDPEADASWRSVGGVGEVPPWRPEGTGGGRVPSTCHWVALDYEAAGRECAYKLVGAGHRRIGLLCAARDPASVRFEKGVRHALGAAGLSIDPAAVQVVDRDAGETGLTAADALLDSSVTGAIVGGSVLLNVFSEATRRRARPVPESVSVVAMLEERRPAWVGGVAVEAYVLSPAEAGREAVQRLRMWSPESPGGQDRLAGEWTSGQSVAPPA